LLVLGGAYLATSITGTGTHLTSSSQPSGSSANSTSANKTISLLSLFSSFSQMQLHEAAFDNSEAAPLIQQTTFSYLVLGKASMNSTQYVKVRFSEIGVNNDIIAWFNPHEGIDRVDIIGDRNYSGSSASIYAQKFLGAMSFVVGASNNSTLLSALSKTSQNTTSIGATKMVVSTYQLTTPTPPYLKATVSYATLPGTDTKIAVYFDQETNDFMETLFQITSLTV
jgi:hypothetical protein